MNLYRIKHVPSGLYLADPYFGGGSDSEWPERRFWGVSGVFWKTPETIMRHLDRITHEWEMRFNDRPYYFLGMKKGAHRPERLDDLAVEIISVTVDSTETVAAKDFSPKRTGEQANE